MLALADQAAAAVDRVERPVVGREERPGDGVRDRVDVDRRPPSRRRSIIGEYRRFRPTVRSDGACPPSRRRMSCEVVDPGDQRLLDQDALSASIACATGARSARAGWTRSATPSVSGSSQHRLDVGGDDRGVDLLGERPAALRPVADAMPRISTPFMARRFGQVLGEHVVAEPDERDADDAVPPAARWTVAASAVRSGSSSRYRMSAASPPSGPLLDRVERGLHVVEVVDPADQTARGRPRRSTSSRMNSARLRFSVHRT